MPTWISEVHLEGLTTLTVVYSLVGLLLLVLLVPVWGVRWRLGIRLLVSGIGLVVGGAIGVALPYWVNAPGLFGVTLSPVILAAAGGSFAGLGLVVVNLVRTRWWRKVVAIIAAPLVLLAGALMINEDVGYYPTLGDALGKQVQTLHGRTIGATVSLKNWRPPSDMPAQGEVVKAPIAGAISHFKARDAWVYLPPAARVARPPRLPVVIALSGEPGNPSDVFYGGDVAATMDSIAAAHRGVAPIVVVPDQLGSFADNPMCVDSKLGRSQTYLMQDVRHWVLTHLPVERARSSWTIAGFSQGGTCAIQLGAAYPTVFGSLLDVSGELAPISGTVAHTIAVGFHGSRRAWVDASPVAVMNRHRYVNMIGLFAVGALDHLYGPAAQRLSTVARHRGMTVLTYLVPGYNHNWNTGALGLSWGFSRLTASWGLPVGTAAGAPGPGPTLPALAPSDKKHHLK